MIKKQILKTLAVMAVLLSLAAAPALAETKNGPLVFTNYYGQGTGPFYTFDPATRLQGGNIWAMARELDVTPNGKTVVYSTSAGDADLYSAPINSSIAPTRLTTTGSATASPTVSPDGKTVYFLYGGFDDRAIYSVPLEGGSITPVIQDQVTRQGLEITPDGKYFLYTVLHPDDYDGKGIYVQPVSGGEATLLYGCNSYCGYPAVSPDGTKVAFANHDDETNREAIYTMEFSPAGGSTPTKVQGSESIYPNFDPTVDFSPDGKYIVYNMYIHPHENFACDPELWCGRDLTRWISVEGGNYQSFSRSEWGFAATEVVWAPAVDDAPVLTLPNNITKAGTSSNGAAVTYPTAPSATDAVDGSVQVNCSKNSGDTFPIGSTTVTCTAEDSVGNKATGSFVVSVVYDWSGVLQPVNADGSSIFKLGTTVPVKFALTNDSVGITDATAKLTYRKIDNGIEGTVIEATSTVNPTAGNLLRYDATSKQYVFNWGTKGLQQGTYRLSIDLGDGTVHDPQAKNHVLVSLKK